MLFLAKQTRPTWFKNLYGFDEHPTDWAATVAHFTMSGEMFICPSGSITQQKITQHFVGPFECPRLDDLRRQIDEIKRTSKSNLGMLGQLTFKHEAISDADGGIKARILNSSSSGAVFQAASQFNCLEMADISKTPLDGIAIYANDHTQGPACALACPAGTVYRNYLVEHGGFKGQNTEQIDNLSDVGEIVENSTNNYWRMQNGYLIGVSSEIVNLNARLLADINLIANLENALRVGVHWDTSVAPPKKHHVCQVYASAIPCTYKHKAPDNLPSIEQWEPLARLVLRAAYLATLAVATILSLKGRTRVVCYLTKLGGGAFGNEEEWIWDAINNALITFKTAPIDVILVHYATTVPEKWSTKLPETVSSSIRQEPVRPLLTSRQEQPLLTFRPMRQEQPLKSDNIPTTLLLLGTSLIRALSTISSTSEIQQPKELQAFDLREIRNNLDKLPSLQKATAKKNITEIDKIIEENINNISNLQDLLLPYNIGITENSMFIDTKNSSTSLDTSQSIDQQTFSNLIYKIRKLPIFENQKDMKKILSQLDKPISDGEVKRLLKDNFNIIITNSKVSIELSKS